MRNFIDILKQSEKLLEADFGTSGKKRRTTDAEFMELARAKFGAKAAKLSLADMATVAEENGVQIPMSIRANVNLKVDAHHWNLSGQSGGPVDPEVDSQIGQELGGDVEASPEKAGEEYDDAIRLSKAKTVARLAASGKIYLMGRKPKGAFFRIPGVEEITAQLERLLSRELESKGDSTMEEQYALLKDKVELVASGKSQFVKALLITGGPSTGKALALDTPIPTPTGWTTMGELKEGDTLYDDQGKPCKVTFATPVQLNRECFEVKFDDNTSIIADADHRWLTSTVSSRYSERRNKKIWEGRDKSVLKSRGTDQSHKRTFPSIVNTKEISETLYSNTKYNHQIINSKPIVGQSGNLVINPYILGLWLGDGTSSCAALSCGSEDIQELCSLLEKENQDFKVKQVKTGWLIQLSKGHGGIMKEKLRAKLRDIGVLSNKHIPVEYLRASENDRMALLQGLMDTDGHVDKRGGACEFSASNERLADDVYELICSLGIKAGRSTRIAKLYKKINHRIHFTTSKPVFRFQRKLNKIKLNARNENERTIMSCSPVASVPVRCITVDSPSHLFLCSRSFIPTHNTYNVMQTIKELGLKEGKDYTVKKGSISVPSLVRTLIERTNSLTIFDDCDSVVEDKNGINILKGALDTDPVREFSRDNKLGINTDVMSFGEREEYCDRLSRALLNKQTSDDIEFFKSILKDYGLLNKALKGVKNKDDDGGDDDAEQDPFADEEDISEEDHAILEFVRNRLPNKIVYKGRIIFISNMAESDWDSAILTRGFYQNMDFKSDEMLDFIDRIKDKIKTPNLDDEKKQEVMDFIRTIYATGKLKRAINFRLVQQAFDLALTENWKKVLSSM
jgi:hypothetical protein